MTTRKERREERRKFEELKKAERLEIMNNFSGEERREKMLEWRKRKTRENISLIKKHVKERKEETKERNKEKARTAKELAEKNKELKKQKWNEKEKLKDVIKKSGYTYFELSLKARENGVHITPQGIHRLTTVKTKIRGTPVQKAIGDILGIDIMDYA